MDKDIKITMNGKQVQLERAPIRVGEKAPNFRAINNQLQPVELKNFKEHTIVITSFPSLDTPVCSAQVREFNKMAASLSDNILIICISCDLPFAQANFCAANNIDKVLVLSDYKDTSFGLQYGLLLSDLRLLARAVLVLDKERYIKYIEVVPEITNNINFKAAKTAIEHNL